MYILGNDLQSDGVWAPSLEALADIAVKELIEQGPSGFVCGPITTGGTGHQILNFEIFNATIRGLKEDGLPIFSQIPYEFGLRRLAREWEAQGNSGYYMEILTVFYARIFETGLINRGWFSPRWESSLGARYEREKFEKLGIEIVDLSLDQIRKFMLREHPPTHVSEVMALLN